MVGWLELEGWFWGGWKIDNQNPSQRCKVLFLSIATGGEGLERWWVEGWVVGVGGMVWGWLELTTEFHNSARYKVLFFFYWKQRDCIGEAQREDREVVGGGVGWLVLKGWFGGWLEK